MMALYFLQNNVILCVSRQQLSVQSVVNNLNKDKIRIKSIELFKYFEELLYLIKYFQISQNGVRANYKVGGEIKGFF